MSELTCLIHMSQECLGCRKELETELDDLKNELEARTIQLDTEIDRLKAELAAQKLETLGLMGGIQAFKSKAEKLAEALDDIADGDNGNPKTPCEAWMIKRCKAALDEFGEGK